ncbi:MAG: hypothetical protein MMC23_007808 [Stictis urceolatum]|nr:hypothetical protein [Stictis urceolata]
MSSSQANNLESNFDENFGFDVNFDEFLQSDFNAPIATEPLLTNSGAVGAIEATNIQHSRADSPSYPTSPPFVYQEEFPCNVGTGLSSTSQYPDNPAAYGTALRDIYPQPYSEFPPNPFLDMMNPQVSGPGIGTSFRSEPWMNMGNKTTKHNWVYGGNYHNRQRNQGPKDKPRHYRPTYCCKCARINRGWYSLQNDGRKICVDCGHIWGDNGSYREPLECCNPEMSASSPWKCRSVDDWCHPNFPGIFPCYPTDPFSLQNYDEPHGFYPT